MFVDFTLILEHSFFLQQQQIQNPLEVAAEQYTSYGTSTRVAKALKELYPQYKPQDEQKEKMVELIVNLISEHIICKLWFVIVYTDLLKILLPRILADEGLHMICDH